MKQSTTLQTAKLYWHHASQKPSILVGLLTALPVTVLINQFLPPMILANVLDRLARHDYQPHNVWASFGPSLLAYGLLAFIGSVTWRLVDHFAWKLEGNSLQSLARQVYSHLLSQSANFHANSFSGSLVSQANKLLSGYVRVADTTNFQVIPLFVSLVFTSIILVGRVPLFVALFLLVSGAYILTALYTSGQIRKVAARHANSESLQTGYLADSLANVMAIKSFAGTNYENRQFNKITSQTRGLLTKVASKTQRQMLVYSGFSSSVQTLAFVMSVISIVNFGANIATVFLVLTYTASTAEQLFTFSNNALRNYNRSFGDASDMTKILLLQPEIKDPPKPIVANITKGTIDFDRVSFTHDGSYDALFNELSLQIPAGQKVGLVGHSGSGKTTFTRLLLRFSDIDSGAIKLDGQNIAQITQDDLHRAIAYVPQEPIMFHRSLFDNIQYGQFDASRQAVLRAAQAAHADDFIKDLPEGYDTLVGERGIKLSGGQRQRIAIARAMLKDAPVLLLDEATSALDSESEVLIQDSLWKLMEGRTAIVIAHRLSTIQKMDRIIVLDDGKIAEQGTHRQLVAKNGAYAKLWAHQSGGFLEDN
jgi:ATP-binding cassette subfamily B protein